MKPEQFAPNTSQSILDDLNDRLARTRWTLDPPGSASSYGTERTYLEDLITYWREQFNWRAAETRIAQLPHFKVSIRGQGIHFIHVRGQGRKPMPLLLTHGWPDSFLRFTKLIPLLTNPTAFGDDAEDAFDVVVPSIPGYGYSDTPKKPGGLFEVSDLWKVLMTEVLGYQRFGAHGGDWGSTITEHLARNHSHSLIGIHLTDVPFAHLFHKPKDPSEAEADFFKRAEQWQREEGAYAMVQSTRPASLAAALDDSPAGLAAWIVEKFQRWSDCSGNVASRFSMDELLTNITLYWVTRTIHSSFWLYHDVAHASQLTWMHEKAKQWTSPPKVPTGFASFPKDLVPPPREWAERFFDVQRWTEMPRGGHFTAWEEPELLARELREFFRPIR